MHMLIRVVSEAYDAEDATGIAHGLFEGVDAPLYPTFDYGTLMTDGGRWSESLPDITRKYVHIRFPFDDLAGIGYQNGWLAACQGSGCMVDMTKYG